MRKLIFAMLFLSSTGYAAVYKCTTPDGKTVFQQTACGDTSGQKEVTIKDSSSGIDGSQKGLDWIQHNNRTGTGSKLYGKDAAAMKRFHCKEARAKVAEMLQRAQRAETGSPDEKLWNTHADFWRARRKKYCK
jgi:hypothetical protein